MNLFFFFIAVSLLLYYHQRISLLLLFLVYFTSSQNKDYTGPCNVFYTLALTLTPIEILWLGLGI